MFTLRKPFFAMSNFEEIIYKKQKNLQIVCGSFVLLAPVAFEKIKTISGAVRLRDVAVLNLFRINLKK